MQLRDFFKSTLWSFTDQFASQLINFISNIILVRLLVPEDFGVFVTPFIIFMFGRTIQDLGTSKIFYTMSLIPMDIKRSIYGFNLLTTFFFGLVLTLAAPSVVFMWTKSEVSQQIMYWLGISYFFSTPLIIHDTLLKHSMKFKRLFTINIVVTLFSAIVGIYLAYDNQGHWSILGKHISYTFTSCLLLLLFSGEFLRPSFNFTKLNSIKSFSFPLLASDTIGFFSRNIDNLFIDRYMGAQMLGIYERAYRFLTLPIDQIAGVISKVLLPALNKSDKNLPEQKLILKYSLQFSFATILPLVAILAIFSEEFVHSLFGLKWVKLIPLLRIFAIISLFQVITSLLSNLFIVKNDTKSLFLLNLITQPFHLINVVVFTIYFPDLVYLSIVYGILSMIHSLIFWVYSLKKIEENIFFLFNSFKSFLISSSILIIGFLLLKSISSTISITLLVLIIMGLTLIFYSFIFFRDKKNLQVLLK